MIQLLGFDLAIGSLAGLWFTPLRVIGRGFWWLLLGLAWAGLLPALLHAGLAAASLPALLGAAGLALLSFATFVPGMTPATPLLLGLTLLSLLAARIAATPLTLPFAAGDALLGAAMLGGANFAMIFGHWYLVIPGLNLDPFRKVARGLIGVTLLRLLLLAAGLALYWQAACAGRLMPLHVFILGGPGTLFFAQRLLYGILAAIPLAFMASRCADLRSTQSATGILYALELVVLVGEGLSRHLMMITRLPL
jgi:hypothetical protein